MSNQVLLKGGRVLDPVNQRDGQLDVLIENGKITAIEANLSVADANTVTLSADQWVLPGLTDLHAHFSEPGNPDKETLESGTQAAIAGGYTSVCLYPNTSPILDEVARLESLLTKTERCAVNLVPLPALTKNLEGQELTEIGFMYQAGARAFTDGMVPLTNPELLRRAFEYSRMFGTPIFSHAQCPSLTNQGYMHEGLVSAQLGLRGIPSAAESTIVARDIEIARQTNGRLHLMHLSAKESVELVRRAKADGLAVTADVTPEHLVFTDASIAERRYSPMLKVKPPFRTEADREALINGLLDGTIDAIATDHMPCLRDEKYLTFDAAPSGIVGLETALSVVLTHVIQKRNLDAKHLVTWMALNPTVLFGCSRGGRLTVGENANLVVVDSKASWNVDPAKFKSKSANTPWAGQSLNGKVTHVWAKGQQVL